MRIRFADFAAEWLKVYAKPNVKVRTYEAYEGSLRVHLILAFGDLLLNEITRRTPSSPTASREDSTTRSGCA
jgi:hypothetical protein